MTLQPVQRSEALPHRLDLPPGIVHLWCQPWPLRTPGTGAVREHLARYGAHGGAGAGIRLGVHGKPELESGPAQVASQLRFNTSHSHDRIALAFARSVAPGVDLERIRERPNALAIAARFFPGAESRWLARLPEADAQRMFHCLWSRREAVAKALGENLGFALNRIEFAADAAGEPVLIRAGDEDPAHWQLHHTVLSPGLIGGTDAFQLTLAWRGADQEVQAFCIPSPDTVNSSATPPAEQDPAAAPAPTPAP